MTCIANVVFMHEDNCFVPMRTNYEYYARGDENPLSARGEEIFDRLTQISFGTFGSLDVMRDKYELVPLTWGAGGAVGSVMYDALNKVC